MAIIGKCIEVIDQNDGNSTSLVYTHPSKVAKSIKFDSNGVYITGVAVCTIKKTIGGVGVIGCDFNFASANNTTAQNIDLGAIIPAYARVIDVVTITNSTFTGATSLAATVGSSSGGNQYITSSTIYAATAIASSASGAALAVAPSASATHAWLGATPGSNWSNVTAGKVSVYFSYIDFTNV